MIDWLLSVWCHGEVAHHDWWIIVEQDKLYHSKKGLESYYISYFCCCYDQNLGKNYISKEMIILTHTLWGHSIMTEAWWQTCAIVSQISVHRQKAERWMQVCWSFFPLYAVYCPSPLHDVTDIPAEVTHFLLEVNFHDDSKFN